MSPQQKTKQTIDDDYLYGNMNPQPKIKPTRDNDYLVWLRSQPCIMCGGGPCQAAHQRLLSGGTGSKPDDKHALPCCPTCHMAEHNNGILSAWNDRTWHAFKDKQDLREYLEDICGRLHSEYLKRKETISNKKGHVLIDMAFFIPPATPGQPALIKTTEEP